MPSDIVRALDALIKSGNVNKDPTYSYPGFEILDIYDIFQHAFNDKAKAAMALKADQLVHQYNEKVESAHVLVLLGKLGLKTCTEYKDQDATQWYVRKFDLVNFAASRATADNLPKAIEKVINTVNTVADLGFTRASMMKLGLLKVMPTDLPEPEYIVISYITLSEKGIKYVEQHMPDAFIPEGGVPPRIT